MTDSQHPPVIADTPQSRHDLRARLLAFRRIGAPLLAAVTDVRFDPEMPRSKEDDAALFTELVESTVVIARLVADRLGAQARPEDDWIRWNVATATTGVVSAHFRSTGRAMAGDQADRVLDALKLTENKTGGAGAEMVGYDPDFTTYLRIRILQAMVPAVGAVARFSFGHDEDSFLARITDRLQNTTAEIMDLLAPKAERNEDWNLLYLGVFDAAVQLYAESHYAEMDRLIDMPEVERAAYVSKHDNRVPLDPVWDNFDLHMKMLTTVASHLKVPESSGINVGGDTELET
ncbi:MAG: hypothetical protein U9N14_07285 [Pseudomonadota bacterium]|nr:hypothetical protein [Pseudomonadota bacterium]